MVLCIPARCPHPCAASKALHRATVAPCHAAGPAHPARWGPVWLGSSGMLRGAATKGSARASGVRARWQGGAGQAAIQALEPGSSAGGAPPTSTLRWLCPHMQPVPRTHPHLSAAGLPRGVAWVDVPAEHWSPPHALTRSASSMSVAFMFCSSTAMGTNSMGGRCARLYSRE